jgi:hypothetical protein
MIPLRAAALLAVVPAVVLVTSRLTLGEMSGDRGRPILMQGAIAGEGGADRARLSIEIERIGFVLNTVQGRYRLARLRFENISTTPVALSIERDTLEADAGASGPVAAVLNLQSSDSPFWDALSPDMRQILAYPKLVKARPSGPGSSAEVVYVYALFPADKVSEVPRSFTYRIDSVGQPVRIAQRATAALP